MNFINRPSTGVLAGLVVLSLVILVQGLPVNAEPVTYDLKSNLWFEGSSTVRDWACKDVAAGGSVQLSKRVTSTKDLFGTLKAMPDREISSTLTFPVKEISCEQGETMNGHLRRALEAKKYPEITFQPREITVKSIADSPTRFVRANVSGDLTIKETTRPVTVRTKVSVVGDDEITVKGTLGIDMTRYGVEPPTVMWTITVYDKITVHTNFQLTPSRP